jgi:NAD(P)H-dependent FMN reductase
LDETETHGSQPCHLFIDPIEINLPLVDRMYKEMTNPSENLIDLHEKIKAAEGYMPITTEYNHSTSAAMKNTLDYFLEEFILNLVP